MATSNVYLTIKETLGADNSLGASGVVNATSGIEVLEFSFAIEQQMSSEEDGRAGFVERVDKTALSIKKAADYSSPKLFQFCCKGSQLYLARLHVFGPRTDREYLVYEMQNVRISKYAPSGGEDLVTEEIEITFGQLSVKFDRAGIGTARNGNGQYGSVEYAWNWVLHVPGFTPMPTEIPL